MARDKSKDYKGGNYQGYFDPEDYEFKFRKKYQSVYTGLKDIWAYYNYPCWDLDLLKKNVVPVPYAPKDKVNCNHKYSLTFKKWKQIIETLGKYYTEFLLSGRPLYLPAKLGSLQLKKWPYGEKGKYFNPYKSAKAGKVVLDSSPENLHYRPLIKWNRGNACDLPKKFFWKINFVKSKGAPWKRIYDAMSNDLSIIHRLNEA